MLRGAVLVKRYYKRMVTEVLNGDVAAEERLCEQNLEVFDEDVRRMLDVYFNFLQRWMTALQTFQVIRSKRAQSQEIHEAFKNKPYSVLLYILDDFLELQSTITLHNLLYFSHRKPRVLTRTFLRTSGPS